MNGDEHPEDGKRDWRISAILAAVWVAGVALIISRDTDIPMSMLALASVFFVFLIPAMNDLVRSIEKATNKSQRAEKEEH